jgi:TPR repeat protein
MAAYSLAATISQCSPAHLRSLFARSPQNAVAWARALALEGTPAAAQWYRRSAEGGYFRGQYNWASVLLMRQCVDEAVVWLERAAHSGTAAVRAAVFSVAASATDVSAMAALAGRLRAAGFGPGCPQAVD